ncbi:MAG: hypothetical protein N2555_03880 [Endomicrobia bacterium]|nr:hypothetical protein [Endomicrobiia bacterium]
MFSLIEFCQNNLYSEGYFKTDLFIHYENLNKKLSDGWIYQKTGPNGINKIYISSPSASSDWTGSQGFKVVTDFDISPVNNLFIRSQLLYLPQYADRFYQTVNDEHRMYLQKTETKITKAEVKYTGNLGYVRYFKGEGHYHWGYEGDIFGLMKEQFEPEKYRRVSGRTVPEGAELNLSYRDKKLHLFVGPEINWGYHDGIYVKVNFDTGWTSGWRRRTFTHTLIFTSDKPEFITFANPEERVTNFAYAIKFKVHRDDTIELGTLHRPFRVEKEYKYVEKEVGEGNGTYGSKYKISTNKVTTTDTFGGKIQYTSYKYKKLVEELQFSYSYLGIVAGNKHELTISGWKRTNRATTIAGSLSYRRPVIGPLPLIKDINGTILLTPRGPFDPFWVNWENREATILTLTCTYDPTPHSWFYIYQPNILDSWNLNPSEDSKFSFAVQTKFASYPTGTDRMYYWDENGKITWDGYNATGVWSTKGFIGELCFVSRMRIYPVRLTSRISFGDSLARGSYAYTEKNLKPITNFYRIGIDLDIYRWWTISTEVGLNIWGPEDWFETFGQSYDRIYKINLTRRFYLYDTDWTLNLGYISTREVDNKYLAPEIGEFDEIKISLSTKFGIKANF